MAAVEKEIDEAIEKAKATPKPKLRSLIEHVYFEVPDELKQQLEETEEFLT